MEEQKIKRTDSLETITIAGKLGVNPQVQDIVISSLAKAGKVVTDIRKEVRAPWGKGWQVVFMSTAEETLGQTVRWIEKIEKQISQHYECTPQNPSLRKKFTWQETRPGYFFMSVEFYP